MKHRAEVTQKGTLLTRAKTQTTLYWNALHPKPRILINHEASARPRLQSLAQYAGFALSRPRSLVSYAAYALPGPGSL
eukprot:6144908-Pyramimonas_sp.AAC.1